MKQTVVGILVLLAVLGGVSQASAGDFNKAGRTAFQFVKIGVGARQSALGEAATANIRDVNSVFWNPAGLSGIGFGEASFSHSTWFADMRIYSGAAGIRWDGVGLFALSCSSLDYGEIQEALSSIGSGSADTRTGNMFTGGDILVGFSYAREFTDHLTIGGTVKWLQEKLFTYNVNLFAFDIGTNYDMGYKGIRIGMSAQNFGKSVKWLANSNREEGYDIPLVFRIGTSVNLIAPGEAGVKDLGTSHTLTLMLDAIHTNDYGDRLTLGGEYWFENILALRTGYRFNYDEGQFSLGVGLKHAIAGMQMRLDYSYVKYEYLESPHRLTIAVEF